MAEALRARGHEVMLFVSEKDIDTLALSGREHFRFEKLPTIGLPSLYSPAILGFVRRFNQSLALCRSIYRKFQPHVILEWADSPPPLRLWLGGCEVWPPLFTSQMPFPAKPIA